MLLIMFSRIWCELIGGVNAVDIWNVSFQEHGGGRANVKI
jgi:hypothetical protein